ATTIVVPPSAVVAPVSAPVRVRAATADSPPAAVTLAPTQFTPAPPTPSQVLPAFPPPGHGGVARALQTAQSYVLLLSLAGAVLMFLGVQGRLDRRDPRIARAPVRDQLEFRDFE
ncbi:MAG TPA: hypothetical protein VGU73_00970, partial [Acidimicrobiia bacterium]|nr:hypothetical protein [Acidimicrobiia bacterium]